MLEKLENKINEELDKVLEKKDYSLGDLKLLIEMKNSLEVQDFLKINYLENNNKGFGPINLEELKGDLLNDSSNNK